MQQQQLRLAGYITVDRVVIGPGELRRGAVIITKGICEFASGNVYRVAPGPEGVKVAV